MPSQGTSAQSELLVEGDKPKKSGEKPRTNGKRMAVERPPREPKAKKSKSNMPAPVGSVWDSVNYSCAYDAMVSPVYNVWQDHGAKWSDRFERIGQFAHILAKGFESAHRGTTRLETARDSMRHALRQSFPRLFPLGNYFASIDDLAEKLYGGENWGSSTIKCTKCDRAQDTVPDFSGMHTITYSQRLRSRYKSDYSVSHWLRDQMVKSTAVKCVCGNGMLKMVKLDDAPPLIYLSMSDTDVLIDTALTLVIGDYRQRYALRGVLYGGENHFTSRIVKPDGETWFHDGIETGKKCVYEGNLHSKDPGFLNSCDRGDVVRIVVGLIYAVLDD